MTAGPSLVIRAHGTPPGSWADLLARCPAPEFTASQTWTELVARHVPGASSLYLLAELEGAVVGGLPAVRRSRRGLARLESSLEGTLAGPQVVADLEPRLRAQVAAQLVGALADQLGGRTILAALAIAGTDPLGAESLTHDPRWSCREFASAVVDCRGGLDQVGTERWTNNRRNERNRGLKRGCTLQAERDPDALAAWYPLYQQQATAWAQAPVPLALLQALLTEPGDHGLFNTVRHDGEIIAGHVCFRSRGRLVAWQGAARPDLQRTHFPTTLVYWQGIREACARGLDAVDFGGSVGRDSLWDFKRRCGAAAEPRWQLLARSRVGQILEGVRARRPGRSR